MTSPFGAATLTAPEQESPPATTVSRSLVTPFSEALASLDEADLDAQAREALVAEFEDEEFAEALEAVADEVAARHLAAAGSWSSGSEAMELSASQAEAWVSSLAARADGLLAELEAAFGERPVESLAEGELEAVTGGVVQESPVDAQELFLSALVKKVTKVAKGVAKVVGKGIRAVGRLVPLGKLFGILRKLVRPLLQRVLARAIGKLPPALRPLATKLAARFGGKAAQPSAAASTAAASAMTAPATAAAPAATVPTDVAAAPASDAPDTAPQDAAASESPWSAEAFADELDATLAELLTSPDPAAADRLVAELEFESSVLATPLGGGPYEALDSARDRLAHAFAEAEPGRPPTTELEQFVPVVMAAMPLVKLGVKVVGRQRVVGFLAKALATLVQGMVGPQAAQQLSRHIADAGLRLLGLEIGRPDGPALGAEALVAATEDTVREVLSLPPASLDSELLLEAAVQEAFTAAAVRHFPAAVLRTDLADGDNPSGGFWVMGPRAVRPHYRYKTWTVVQPVRLGRAEARAVVLGEGETLEDRLLEAGVRSWPVDAEAHFYELLPGGEVGHLAAFETDGAQDSFAEAALEFEQLSPSRPLPFPHPRTPPGRGGPAGRRHRPAGTRFVRLVVRGRRLRRRRRLSVRFDLSAPQPQLRLHLHLGEQVSHELVTHLGKQDMTQVVGVLRRFVGEPARAALAERLRRHLGKQGIAVTEDASRALANSMAEAVSRVVANTLPASAQDLAGAARDAKPGVTLTFTFAFADRKALEGPGVPEPTLRIRPGVHRD